MTNQVRKIGAVPTLLGGDATYSAGLGQVLGGPSRTQMHVEDSNRVGSGLIAGENLGAWDACFVVYQNGVGYVYRSFADNNTGTYTNPAVTVTATQKARCVGFADAQTFAGEAVTLWGAHVEANYVHPLDSGSLKGLATIGTILVALFVSESTAGGLQDAVSSVINTLPAVAVSEGDGRIRSRAA